MVEGARLESVYRGDSIVGSNPTVSASFSSLARKRDGPACARCWAHRRLLQKSPLMPIIGIEHSFVILNLFQDNDPRSHVILKQVQDEELWGEGVG